MNPKTITSTFSTGGQITAADVRRLADRGFRSIICNRPDSEGPDQPAFAEIAAAAQAVGLQARHIPVVAGNVSNADAAAFRRALDELPKPVFAYCRSGMRSSALWSLSQSRTRSERDGGGRARA
jgi:sulfide:quinone oxidoreductase